MKFLVKYKHYFINTHIFFFQIMTTHLPSDQIINNNNAVIINFVFKVSLHYRVKIWLFIYANILRTQISRKTVFMEK